MSKTIREYLGGTTIKVNGEEKKFESKSKMFLALYDEGMSTADIAKLTESHYSFVHGVLHTHRDIQTTKRDSKSEQIRLMVDAGKTPGEIARELNSNYSFVHSVVKKYRTSKEKVGGDQ